MDSPKPAKRQVGSTRGDNIVGYAILGLFLLVAKESSFFTLEFLNLYNLATCLVSSNFIVVAVSVTMVISTVSTFTSLTVSCACAAVPMKRIKKMVAIVFMTCVCYTIITTASVFWRVAIR